MKQQSLIRDTVLEAIRDDVDALGGEKVVGLMLWPDKRCPIKAGKHLQNCLTEDRAERLTPEQVNLIIREARKAGSFCTIAFICDDASMTRPTPIEPEDKRAVLQREFIDAVDKLESIKSQIVRIEGGNVKPLRA